LPNSQGLQRTLLTRGAVLPTDGPGSRLYFAVIDITQLRQRGRERALQLEQLHQRLQLATEAAGIGTWEWDARTRQGKWDAQAIALFGLQEHRGDLKAEDFFERIHPDDRADLVARWLDPHSNPSAFDPLVRVLLPGEKQPGARPDAPAQTRWVQARGRREYDSAGKLLKRVGVCFDVTQRHEAEVNRQAKELAEQANAEKTQFLSRMSHELRTPLNAVLGFAQLLTMDTTAPLAPTQLARVGHIQQAGWHLLSLINDVLDLTHLEAHEAPLVLNAVAVHEALQSCVDAVALQRERAAGGTASGSPDTAASHWQTVQLLNRCLPQNANLTVRADASRLAQALVNVVSFLAKRTGLGGTVEISAMASPGDMVSLLARDDGPPLTADELRLLFEPFSRQGPEMPVVDGTGIGLTLAKLIIEQMGGQLQVSSAPDTTSAGTLFELQLPAGS
jgi:signal transduction histidine kinase